jgi:hypothetical protein
LKLSANLNSDVYNVKVKFTPEMGYTKIIFETLSQHHTRELEVKRQLMTIKQNHVIKNSPYVSIIDSRLNNLALYCRDQLNENKPCYKINF